MLFSGQLYWWCKHHIRLLGTWTSYLLVEHSFLWMCSMSYRLARLMDSLNKKNNLNWIQNYDVFSDRNSPVNIRSLIENLTSMMNSLSPTNWLKRSQWSQWFSGTDRRLKCNKSFCNDQWKHRKVLLLHRITFQTIKWKGYWAQHISLKTNYLLFSSSIL